jgi:hypothetical protein
MSATLASLHGAAAHAATALATLRYIPDITVNLNGQRVGPTDLTGDTLNGATSTPNLPGGTTAMPSDSVGFDGG